MASNHDTREEKLFVDQKILNHTSDFFSRNAVKFLILFVVVMAAVVVYVVKTHVSTVTERDVGDYLDANFYSVINERGPVLGGEAAGVKAVNVPEVLAKIEGTKQRPAVLYRLAQYLFEKGGSENLKEAATIVATLKKDYESLTYYQALAGNLEKKIAEELEFKMPEPDAAGPKTEEAPPAASAAGTTDAPKVDAPKAAEAPKADAPAPAPSAPPAAK